MKRFITLILTFALTTLSLFAITDSLTAYDTPGWLEFYKVIKEDKSPEEVEKVYLRYMSSKISSFEKARAENIYSRYLVDKGDKTGGKEHLEREKEYFDAISEEDELIKMIADIDYNSAKFYIDKDLGAGLENSNLTKKAMKMFPDEAYIIITDGWRLIYTPQIAGGSNKNAIKELEVLLKSVDQLCISNQYSLYGALATAHYNRKNYDDSRRCLDIAFSYYYGEPPLLELDEKLKEKKK